MDPEHSILAMDISVKASMSDIKSTDNLFFERAGMDRRQIGVHRIRFAFWRR